MKKRLVKKILHTTRKKLRPISIWFSHGLRFASLTFLWGFFFLLAGVVDPSVGSEKIVVRDFQKPIIVSPYPVVGSIKVPQVTAKSFLVVDGSSGVVLASKEPNQKIYPASLTKLMTALVTLDYYDFDTVLTVKRLAPVPGEAEMGLEVGDQATVRTLLYGLLVPSGNDAAYALADNYFGGIENFVFAMNKKTSELHLNNTNFRNPSGADEDNHRSSAKDLLILTRAFVANEELRNIVATHAISLFDFSGTKSYEVKNVNQLLGLVSGVNGVKTGYTDLAGECLITSTTRNGRTLYTIVLNSKDRFFESVTLLEWAFGNTKWEIVD